MDCPRNNCPPKHTVVTGPEIYCSKCFWHYDSKERELFRKFMTEKNFRPRTERMSEKEKEQALAEQTAREEEIEKEKEEAYQSEYYEKNKGSQKIT